MAAPPVPLARVREAWLGLPANSRGVVWVVLFAACFAAADTLAKSVALQLDLLVLLFLRYAISLVFITPVVACLGFASIATRRPGLHAVRTVMAVSAQLLLYYALVNMYVADVTAIAFARPLFVTLLAVVVLGETVGWRRWTATAVGFGGVLVMVRPSASGIDLAAGGAVLATLIFGVVMVMVRRYAASESPIKFVFYYHAFGALLALGPAIAFWRTPAAGEWVFIVAIAFTATIAQTFGIRAYSVGEASVVGPIEYTRLLFAAAFGYLAFAEIPGAYTWIGATIIIGSALYIARREAAQRRRGAGGAP